MEDLPPYVTCRQLGRALWRWRRLNSVKQGDVAERLGVSQATISRIEAGQISLPARDCRKLGALIAAQLTSASDRALHDLISMAPTPVHLICDLSHRLLAASPARLAQWRLDFAELKGRSLWPYASAGIELAEKSLASKGWHEAADAEFKFDTEGYECSALRIEPGLVAWTRMPLSDGTFARLVRQLRGRAE